MRTSIFKLRSLLLFVIFVFLILFIILFINKPKKSFVSSLSTASEIIKNIGNSGLISYEQDNVESVSASTPESGQSSTPESGQSSTPESQTDYPFEVRSGSTRLSVNSFGDNFSSQAYLDLEKSNMFLDEYVTSLIFPPVYSYANVKACDGNKCIADSDNQLFFAAKSEYCLNNSCLKITDNKILYNNKNVNYPSELNGKKILNVRASLLSSRFIVSFVFSADNIEQGYVYYFDGKNFTPIIGSNTSEKISSAYGKGKGVIIVNGTDDDFIIFYAGYKDIAYHFRKGQLYNISRFFGFRVSYGNFIPQIIKQGEGTTTLWYLIGPNDDGFKMIKLWQNGTNNIMGAYDFNKIFSKSDGLLISVKNNNNRGQLDFTFKNSNGKFTLWHFQDKGFDNSQDRVVTSKNLATHDKLIHSAVVQRIGLALGSPNHVDYETHFPNSQVKLFLGNTSDNFVEVKPKVKIIFSSLGKNLFWRAEFKKADNNEYSPWFDHVNSLDYYIADK